MFQSFVKTLDLRLGCFARTYILGNRAKVLRLALVVHQRYGVVDPNGGVIAANVALFERVMLNFASTQGAHARERALAVIRMSKIVWTSCTEFFAAIAGDLAQPLVYAEPLTVKSNLSHPDGGLLKRSAKTLFAFR